MPIVLCIYCQYIGKGNTLSLKWKDVQKHEKICTENPENWETKEEDLKLPEGITNIKVEILKEDEL